jgi:hypothetical protein
VKRVLLVRGSVPRACYRACYWMTKRNGFKNLLKMHAHPVTKYGNTGAPEILQRIVHCTLYIIAICLHFKYRKSVPRTVYSHECGTRGWAWAVGGRGRGGLTLICTTISPGANSSKAAINTSTPDIQPPFDRAYGL